MMGQAGPGDGAQLRAVLATLGPPRRMAHRFHPPQPLIRPEHVPLYQSTLFLVFGALFLIQIVDSSVSWLTRESMSLLLFAKSITSGLIENGAFAFTVISLGFWLMGREGGPARPKPTATAKAWNPDTLPPVVQAWQRIGLVDIFSDLGNALFLLILIWYPVWAGLPTTFGLSEKGHGLLQVFSPLLVAGLALGIGQLRWRIWTAPLLWANLILNALFVIAITVLILSGPLVTRVPERLDWIEPEQLALSLTLTLLAVALFLVWDGVRSIGRLRKLAAG
jgi:hypothetical protein